MRALLGLLIAGEAAAAPCKQVVVDAANQAWGATGQKPDCRAIGGMVFVRASVGLASDDIFYAALVDGAHVAWQAVSAPGTPGDTFSYSFADLDGDGRDELLVHDHHDGHMGTGSERLTVLRIAHGDVTEVAELMLAIGMDHRDGNSCSSSGLAIVGGRTRRVQLTTVYTKLAGFPPPEGCLPEGQHRFPGFVLAD